MFSDEFGFGFCRASFSHNRFKFLNRMLRFDDKSTREWRRATDKLAPVREIWDQFIKNCTDSFEPSTDCTIDEQLVSFRGHCSFRIYMKNKPDKYGMKIVMLNDSEIFYMILAISYVGKVNPEEDEAIADFASVL